jgi:hypothetical protein
MSGARVASNDRISIFSFGFGYRPSVDGRKLATPADPLLAGAEVVDVAEEDVPHGLAVGHGERHRKERDLALRVERAVDRVDDHHRAPGAEASDLLGDDRDVEVAKVREDCVLGRLVDGRRLVAAETLPDDRLTLGAARQLLEDAPDVLGRGAADGEPVGHNGRNSSPLVSFG